MEFFSPVEDSFPMGCKIKEGEEEGHIFRKENFKESLFHVLYVKEREQKADCNIQLKLQRVFGFL